MLKNFDRWFTERCLGRAGFFWFVGVGMAGVLILAPLLYFTLVWLFGPRR